MYSSEYPLAILEVPQACQTTLLRDMPKESLCGVVCSDSRLHNYASAPRRIQQLEASLSKNCISIDITMTCQGKSTASAHEPPRGFRFALGVEELSVPHPFCRSGSFSCES